MWDTVIGYLRQTQGLPSARGISLRFLYLYAMIRYVGDGFDYSTSFIGVMTCEQIGKPITSAKFAAYEMFSEMRGSTDEEKALYEDMLARMSKPISVDIFSL